MLIVEHRPESAVVHFQQFEILEELDSVEDVVDVGSRQINQRIRVGLLGEQYVGGPDIVEAQSQLHSRANEAIVCQRRAGHRDVELLAVHLQLP